VRGGGWHRATDKERSGVGTGTHTGRSDGPQAGIVVDAADAAYPQ